MNGFKAGDLRETLTVLRHEEGQPDQYGRRSERWVEAGKVQASARDVSGREFYEAAAHQMENVITFAVRSEVYLTNADRIIFRGDTYEILQVNHVGYRGFFQTVKARIIQPEVR